MIVCYWADRKMIMGFSKVEVNLRRLLVAAPQQPNQAKLIHYVATLREQLEQLGEETTPTGLPRISKAKLHEYSEKIEALAAKLATPQHCLPVKQLSLLVKQPLLRSDNVNEITVEQSPSETEKSSPQTSPPQGLRRRFSAHEKVEVKAHEEIDPTKTIKLDAGTQAHVAKHRKLQEDLTDEMVVLAQQLRESSLMMNQSLQDTEKILDSTERAVEHSLASTGHANVRAMTIYSESSKTTCFTWLLMFVMTCVFIMMTPIICSPWSMVDLKG
ncbi:hypothetical protein ACLOJK_017911 [Asimina triloba]